MLIKLWISLRLLKSLKWLFSSTIISHIKHRIVLLTSNTNLHPEQVLNLLYKVLQTQQDYRRKASKEIGNFFDGFFLNTFALELETNY